MKEIEQKLTYLLTIGKNVVGPIQLFIHTTKMKQLRMMGLLAHRG